MGSGAGYGSGWGTGGVTSPDTHGMRQAVAEEGADHPGCEWLVEVFSESQKGLDPGSSREIRLRLSRMHKAGTNERPKLENEKLSVPQRLDPAP